MLQWRFFAFDFKYFSHGALSVELHVVAHGYGAVIGIAVGLDLLLFALRRFFQQRMFVAVIVEQMLFGLLKLLSRFEGFLFVGLRALLCHGLSARLKRYCLQVCVVLPPLRH